MIPVLNSADIRPFLDIQNLIPSAKTAFQAISNGDVQTPVHVLHLNERADMHIKSATLPDCPIFTVKMAGWSGVLADQGLPTSSGMIAVFDSATCKPLAILCDDHLISDYRTAAAGAYVAQILAPKSVSSAVVIGTGIQAGLQIEALLHVRAIKQVHIWGRSAAKALALKTNLQRRFPDVDFYIATDLAKVVPQTDVIIAATGAKKPILRSEWVRPGQHITSVGSDDATKCEIDPVILKSANVYVDAISSAQRFGAPHHAIAAGFITASELIEIGEVGISCVANPDGPTLACLSGLGIQDLTAVASFWDKLRHNLTA